HCGKFDESRAFDRERRRTENRLVREFDIARGERAAIAEPDVAAQVKDNLRWRGALEALGEIAREGAVAIDPHKRIVDQFGGPRRDRIGGDARIDRGWRGRQIDLQIAWRYERRRLSACGQRQHTRYRGTREGLCACG